VRPPAGLKYKYDNTSNSNSVINFTGATNKNTSNEAGVFPKKRSSEEAQFPQLSLFPLV
jgi:hypothetical protein